MRKLMFILFFGFALHVFNCSALKIAGVPKAAPRKIKVTEQHYRIYKIDGFREIDLPELIDEIKDYDIVFIGEHHNDPVAHYFELEIVKGIYAARGRVAVSMEMFERDVQYILDEYLHNKISEEFLIKDARAWVNYKADYKPIVEFAKRNKQAVIAANAPRRYTRIVSGNGLDKLSEISQAGRQFVAPLPINLPEGTEYRDKFLKTMQDTEMPGAQEKNKKGAVTHDVRENPSPRLLRIYQAQVTWDATMAYSIEQYHLRNPRVPVVQVNGSFHSDNHMGILYHLEQSLPHLKMVTVSVIPVDKFPEFDRENIRNLADIVVIADNSLPRTY